MLPHYCSQVFSLAVASRASHCGDFSLNVAASLVAERRLPSGPEAVARRTQERGSSGAQAQSCGACAWLSHCMWDPPVLGDQATVPLVVTVLPLSH